MEKVLFLHLDDWEHLDELSNNPVGQQDFIWGHLKVKILNTKLSTQFLKKIKMETYNFLY